MKKEENKATTPRSFIRINNTEHNLIALVELLNQNGANIYNIICPKSLPKSVIGIYGGYTLALSSQLEVGLGYQETRRILESSREFRGFVDSILGEVV